MNKRDPEFTWKPSCHAQKMLKSILVHPEKLTSNLIENFEVSETEAGTKPPGQMSIKLSQVVWSLLKDAGIITNGDHFHVIEKSNIWREKKN